MTAEERQALIQDILDSGGNCFGIGRRGELVTTLRAVPLILSRQEALNLAAWLVALADPGQQDFFPLLKQVLAT